MLINLLPDFLAVLDAADRGAAYQQYREAHRPVLDAYWHNYVLDPDSAHAEAIVTHALAEMPSLSVDERKRRGKGLNLVKRWLGEAEEAYGEATRLRVDERNLIYYQGTEAAAYFMGIAYLEGLEFARARDAFAAVLNAKAEGKWHAKADRAWKKTDMPEGMRK